jgi:opacity protein-like surface antigen
MKIIIMLLTAVSAVTLSTATASAQPPSAPRMAVSFASGAASADSTTGVMLGGSWMFDLTRYTSIEAEGMYLDRGDGSDAFSAASALLINLLPGHERIVPYAAAGGGIYRASFDLGHPALFGPIGAELGSGSVICPGPGSGFGNGPGFGPGTGTCPADAAGSWGVGRMPAFYGRRLGPMAVPPGGAWDGRSFTDPAVSVGGGVRFNVHERLMVRPEARALVVFADGDTHTVGVFRVQLGYRF